jgi:hypothetical protein
LAAIIERRFAAREYQPKWDQSTNGSENAVPEVAISMYVFHREGAPIGEFRKSWARACYLAGLPCELIYKKDSKGNVMFHNGGTHKGEPIIEKILSKMIFHDLRRTAVRNMVRAGVREGVAMAISGHRTRSVFDRYNITSDEDIRQAVKQTAEHVNAQPVLRRVVAIGKKYADLLSAGRLLRLNHGRLTSMFCGYAVLDRVLQLKLITRYEPVYPDFVNHRPSRAELGIEVRIFRPKSL